ncbi:MAG: thiamine diphosphokinase [Bacteroidaceae bacterium]|nr:thiamine diphosphokinase [Bacteroidaceae bacterium]
MTIDPTATPVVILAAGDYPWHPLPQRLLSEARMVVCLDSAADAYHAHTGRLPHLVVGDGDSLSTALRHRLADRLVIEAEQDTNDLCKAVRLLSRSGVGEAVVLGATGRREDHTLGNIFHLPDLNRLMRLTMVTDSGTFTPCHGTAHFHLPPRTPVSVFNISAQTLRSHGLRWPLRAFTQLWQGTLNEAAAPQFTTQGDGDYIVFTAHPQPPQRRPQ